MSLRFRLNLMIALILLLMVGAGTASTIYAARRSVREEVSSSVRLASRLIEYGLRAGTAPTETSLAARLEHLAALHDTRHLRILLLSPDGGAVPPIHVAGLDGPPGWFRRALDPPPLWSEQRIETAAGRYTLRIEADPDDEIREAWGECRSFFGVMGLIALALYVAVQISVTRTFRSVAMIIEGLEQLEHGRFDLGPPRPASPEFARIARAIGHASAALARAREDMRRLIGRSLRIQEEERRDLARELHDDLAQSLTAIRITAAALGRRAGDRDQRGALQSIVVECDRLFQLTRNMMRRLRPSALDELDLPAALEDLLAPLQRHDPPIAANLSIDAELPVIAPQVAIQLYRIAQEGITNMLRHAAARRIELRLDAPEPGQVRLCLCDDGKGFDPDSRCSGLGLVGIRERAESLGGSFRLETSPGQGTRLEVRVPACPEPSHDMEVDHAQPV